MEMMQLLTAEQEKEQNREKQLNNCHDAIEKQELESKFGIDRAKAQKKIEKTMIRHRDELKKMKKGLI